MDGEACPRVQSVQDTVHVLGSIALKGSPMEGRCSGALGAVVGMRSDCRRESRIKACMSVNAAAGWSDAECRRALSPAAVSSASAVALLLGLRDLLAVFCCRFTQHINT